MAMPDPDAATAEDLLAQALAAFDSGGEEALATFITAHPEHAALLQRGVQRCRDMGLLGRPGTHDFPERLGDFRLLRRIGGGGMGVVYEAEQVQIGRRVALKVIRPELLFFEGARERFRREVDAIAKLSHPAIVPVLAFGEHEGVPYFAMELLAGATVEEVCAAQRDRDPSALTGKDLHGSLGPAPDETTSDIFAGEWWQACARLAHQVCLGLRHAHLRGIVHRDIKPSNVMLTPHGQAILLDFGVAQVGAGRDLTRSGATPGSPAFMSPEQIRGDATDERTDVYSLAATLWQVLSLRRPFADRNLQEAIQQGQLPAMRARNRRVPRELEIVLRTAMDRDRDRRYRDAGAFAADLWAVLQRRPIAARPLGFGLRAVRWCQRHRVAATALVALALGAAAVPAAVLWQQRRANAVLRAEQQRTQESLDTSLDALHAVLVRLGNDQLRNVPLAEQIAHETLTDAAVLYRKLLQQHPEHARVRVQGGRAVHALSMSFERQGKTAQAIDTVREAVAILAGDRLDCAPVQLDVRAHANMGLSSFLTDAADHIGAAAAVDAAERDFVAAARAPAFVVAALRGRAMLRTTRSLLLDEREQPGAVEATLREAVALQRDALAQGSTDAKDPGLLVTHLTNLAKFLARRERRDDARAVYEEALGAAQSPRNGKGVWPPPAVAVAEIQEGLGNLLSHSDPVAAETSLLASLATRERLVEQFPTNLSFRIALGGTLHNVGTCVLRGERAEEALTWFERARACQAQAFARAPKHPQCRTYYKNHLNMLGRCQVTLRRTADLLATAHAMAQLDGDGRVALDAARLYMQAHRLQAESPDTASDAPNDPTDAAMQQLILAEQRGLATLADLEDELFAPLHARQEWRELVARVEAKAGR